MKQFMIIILFLSFFLISYAEEFIYPVGHSLFGGKLTYYLIYQKDESHIELFSWDPDTKIISKCLSSRFNPASVAILPDFSGFSFIDDGIVWIKSFMKRSPSPLSPSTPIYGQELLQWIDGGEVFYTSAQQRGRFSIIQCDHDGKVDTIVSLPLIDCLYPQKIGQYLFYIERAPIKADVLLYHYSIIRTNYPLITYSYFQNETFTEKVFAEKVNQVLTHDFNTKKDEQKNSRLILLGQRPAMFLSMICEREGFFIEYPAEIQKTDQTISCNYHYLTQNNTSWEHVSLFTFHIPTSVISDFSDKNNQGPRLYESILRLVPMYSKKHRGIFYTNYTSESLLQLCFFDLVTLESKCISSITSKKNFFSPIVVGEKVVYGGTVNTQRFIDNEEKIEPPYMWVDESSEVYLEMPTY